MEQSAKSFTKHFNTNFTREDAWQNLVMKIEWHNTHDSFFITTTDKQMTWIKTNDTMGECFTVHKNGTITPNVRAQSVPVYLLKLLNPYRYVIGLRKLKFSDLTCSRQRLPKNSPSINKKRNKLIDSEDEYYINRMASAYGQLMARKMKAHLIKKYFHNCK